MASSGDSNPAYTVLVTGANSGLGYATCCRLIDEFLATRPLPQRFHLIITTRDKRKNDDTLHRLRRHVQKTLVAVYGSSSSIRNAQRERITLEGETVELTSLVTVKALGKRLLARDIHIDALVLNAGIGGWTGMNWPVAIWTVMTDMVHATTYPIYKLGTTGKVLGPQLQEDGSANGKAVTSRTTRDEPALGELFTANVFGHYMLAHDLMPLLSAQPSATQRPGRVIWISSVEAQSWSFQLSDIQGLQTNAPYESSKRLTDLLALTSNLPSTRRYVSAYKSTGTQGGTDEQSGAETPEIYVCHPGVCATSISGLPLFLTYAMLVGLYMARWLGSPWHPIDPYKGAMAGTWLALAAPETLEHLDKRQGKGKWGSSTDWTGSERLIRTEVEGWGYSGNVGEGPDGGMRIGKGRHRQMKETTKELREEFEVVGGKAWREMEELRMEWDQRLNSQ